MNCQVLTSSGGGRERNSAADFSPCSDSATTLPSEPSLPSKVTRGTGESDFEATSACSNEVQFKQQLSPEADVLFAQQSEKISGYADANAHAFVAGNQPINISVRTVVRRRFTSGH